MEKVTLESIVEAVNDLPALPHVVVRIMELTEDPNTTAQQINDVLNQDQGMTAKVLRLANSAFYGFPRRISTVTDATVFLGFKTVRSIVMAASVSDLLSREVEGYALAPGELWRHSQCVAISARLIAKTCKFYTVDVAYTAALLHDIGKVVLNSTMKQAYHEVVAMVESENIPFSQAEDQILGFNHAMVGAKIAEKWNLPPELVEAIAYHHNPEQSKINLQLTSIVHIADVICLSMGMGIGIDGMLYPLSPEAMQTLKFSEKEAENTISQLVDLFIDQQSF
ncbi:MAG: hydrolase [Firmicutes bacterium HGW-Firmicutes-15]|nr:MAG: hydrolase [Firmicutes bacterium HGW-Firmicutes-15]